MRRIGMQNVRLIETPGNPGRLRRLARRAGRADDPLLRPLRRAAGRSARPVGLAAVRGDRARRRDLRARLRRRQGPGVHALQGDRGAPEAERHAAGEHQGHHRGRGGSRQRQSRQLRHAPQGRARAPTSSSSPTRRCSTAASRRSATACAAWSTSRSTCAARKSDLHSGSFGGAVANPGMVLAQILAQMKDRGGRIKIPGFYDDVRRAEGGGARRSGRSCRSTRSATRKELGAPKLFGETGYSTLERVWARPTFEVNGLLGGLHRRRRQDRDSGRRDGEGQHAARAESGSRTRSPSCSRTT